MPANFTERTGRDHWEVLLRARAIENGAWVLAPSQIGGPPGSAGVRPLDDHRPVGHGRRPGARRGRDRPRRRSTSTRRRRPPPDPGPRQPSASGIRSAAGDWTGRYHALTDPGTRAPVSDTLSTERPTAAPIRTQVRDAVRAAWDAAVADGALPALPEDGAAGHRGRTPRRPGARRLRQQPRDEARPAVPHGAARDRARRSRPSSIRDAASRPAVTPIARGRGRAARVPQPAAARRRARGDRSTAILARPGGLGSASRRSRPRVGQRRVRVGQPDRAAARSATPAARSSATC